MNMFLIIFICEWRLYDELCVNKEYEVFMCHVELRVITINS